MLVEFRFGNYRSFAKESFIQMDAIKALKEPGKDECMVELEDCALLKSAAIYGANASGKSNVIQAMRFFRNFILESGKYNSQDKIDVQPFALCGELRNSPSLFEARFTLGDGVYYRYGFEIDCKSVKSEWLLWSKKFASRDMKLFVREGSDVRFGLRMNANGIRENDILPNALLLSRLDQMNNETACRIMKWFKEMQVFTGMDDDMRQSGAFSAWKYHSQKRSMLEFLRLADPTIEDIVIEQKEGYSDGYILAGRQLIPGYAMPFQDVISIVRRSDDGRKVKFNLTTDESSGTLKMFCMAGRWLGLLESGSVAFVDELEAKLHPLLVIYLINKFNSSSDNPIGAQLVFATHDVNILDYCNLRRDQFWFCEKNAHGESSLYSLSEIKDQESKRNGSPLRDNYLKGRYGAIPFTGYEAAQD